MTLVALFRNQGAPILVGDLLVSAESSSRSRPNLPTIGEKEVPYAAGNTYHQVTIKQKICIVTDEIVAGLAGDRMQARTFLRELSEFAGEHYRTGEDLNGYLRAFSWKDLSDISGFVVCTWLIPGGRRFGMFTIGTGAPHFPYCDSPYWGQVTAVGTGAQAFVERVGRKPVDPPFLTDNASPVLQAALKTLQIVSTCLADEIRTSGASSLSDHWGGGFELAQFIDGRFRKVEDITFCIWNSTLELVANRKVSALKKIIKTWYEDSTLLVRAFDCVRTDAGIRAETDFQYFIDDPRTMRRPNVRHTNVSLNSRFVCHVIFVQMPNGRTDTAVSTMFYKAIPAPKRRDSNGRLLFDAPLREIFFDFPKNGGDGWIHIPKEMPDRIAQLFPEES